MWHLDRLSLSFLPFPPMVWIQSTCSSNRASFYNSNSTRSALILFWCRVCLHPWNYSDFGFFFCSQIKQKSFRRWINPQFHESFHKSGALTYRSYQRHLFWPAEQCVNINLKLKGTGMLKNLLIISERNTMYLKENNAHLDTHSS